MLLGWCVCVCACMCWWAGGAPNSHHPKLPSPFVDGVGLSSSSRCFCLLLATGTVTNRWYRYHKYDDHSCHYYGSIMSATNIFLNIIDLAQHVHVGIIWYYSFWITIIISLSFYILYLVHQTFERKPCGFIASSPTNPILTVSDSSGSVNWLSDAGNCAQALALRSLAASKNLEAMAAVGWVGGARPSPP